MNFNKIKASEIIGDISWTVEGRETSYLAITSDDVLVWKNWNKDEASSLMYGYLKNKFNMLLNEKNSNSIVLDLILPKNTSKETEKTFETILKSFFKVAGFSLSKIKKTPTGQLNIRDYFEYLDGMNNEEALSISQIQNAGNKLTEPEKIKKAEELIFAFSKDLWTDAQVAMRIDQILALEIDFNLINPAKRNDKRHPKQWFLDLLNYTNIKQWESGYDNHAATGNWINNAVSMAVSLLPHIGPIEMLKLDGKEYKPNLTYGNEKEQWTIFTRRPTDKDILNIIVDETFTKYNQLPPEHFLILLEHVLNNCSLTKKRSSDLSYQIMSGYDSNTWNSRFTYKELLRAYTALINATPKFSKEDIGWRIKSIENSPETLEAIEKLILKNELEQSLHSKLKSINKIKV